MTAEEKALRKAERAAGAKARAAEAFEAAVVSAARTPGVSFSQIAERVGLSKARVHQIVREEETCGRS